jgi:predicted acyltransferase
MSSTLETPQIKQRNVALDVLRGMTICFMIIVNTPGNGDTSYAPLQHAKWFGFTPTDLVFPTFLFVVGNAMSFVMKKWDAMPRSKVIFKILKRTFIIFLLGYLMYWFPFFRLDANNHIIAFPIGQTRIMGVLQRIALCYGIASFMIYFLKEKVSVIICVAILFIYWFVMMHFGNPNDPLSMQGNAGFYLDKWLMGENHMYHGEGVAFDPEGWLSTFPAIGNVIAGYVVGKWVQEKGNSYEGVAKLLIAGFGLLVCGYFWDLLFPIAKKLWTSSFVVYTVGLDCIILGILIYFIQLQNSKSWTGFFQVFGKNPLFIYLLSELMVTVLYMIPVGTPSHSLFKWIYENIFIHFGAYPGSLFFAIAYMLFCWFIGYLLDRRKIYIRV